MTTTSGSISSSEFTTFDALLKRKREITGETPFEVEDGFPQPSSITVSRLTYLHDLAHATGLSDAQRQELALPEPVDSADLMITTSHFDIYYSTSGPNAVSTAIANDVAATLEAAVSAFFSYFGTTISGFTNVHFDATSAHYTDPSTGIHFNADAMNSAGNNKPYRDQTTIHECFHVWQFQRGWAVSMGGTNTYWVLEGTAVWAAMKWTLPSGASLANPYYLSTWFDRPESVAIVRPPAVAKNAQGYVTLPFWIWIEGQNATSFKQFMNSPTSSPLPVDSLASKMGQPSMEALACAFGAALVRSTWNTLYPTFKNIEQRTQKTIPSPTFSPSTKPEYTAQLDNSGSTWNFSSPVDDGAIVFFDAQYRLSGQDPSKTWTAVLDLASLDGDSGVTAYFAITEYPGGQTPEVYSSWYTPVSRVFGDPTKANVNLIVSGNQHPRTTKRFKLAVTAEYKSS